MMKKVNESHSGRTVLYCPNCKKNTLVSHLGWVSLQCPHCTKLTAKCDWLVADDTQEGKSDD